MAKPIRLYKGGDTLTVYGPQHLAAALAEIEGFEQRELQKSQAKVAAIAAASRTGNGAAANGNGQAIAQGNGAGAQA